MSIFASLHPLLKHGPLNLTLASDADDKIRVCILPTVLENSDKPGAPKATFPPMTFVGTVSELDDELAGALAAGVVTPALSLIEQADRMKKEFEAAEKAAAEAAKAAAEARKKKDKAGKEEPKKEEKPAKPQEPDLFTVAAGASATPTPTTAPAPAAEGEDGEDGEEGDGESTGK